MHDKEKHQMFTFNKLEPANWPGEEIISCSKFNKTDIFVSLHFKWQNSWGSSQPPVRFLQQKTLWCLCHKDRILIVMMKRTVFKLNVYLFQLFPQRHCMWVLLLGSLSWCPLSSRRHHGGCLWGLNTSLSPEWDRWCKRSPCPYR